MLFASTVLLHTLFSLLLPSPHEICMITCCVHPSMSTITTWGMWGHMCVPVFVPCYNRTSLGQEPHLICLCSPDPWHGACHAATVVLGTHSAPAWTEKLGSLRLLPGRLSSRDSRFVFSTLSTQVVLEKAIAVSHLGAESFSKKKRAALSVNIFIPVGTRDLLVFDHLILGVDLTTY